MIAMRGFLFLLLVGMLLLPLGNNPGAADSFVCTVHEAGPTGAKSAVRILLSDAADKPEFTKKWFAAQPGREKEMLAVALAAIGSEYQVRAVVNIQKSLITALYVIVP